MHTISYVAISLLMTGITTGITQGADQNTDLTCEKFKNACEKNDFGTIQTMLEDQQMPSHEIGNIIFCLFDVMNKKCLTLISSHHPYAIWDSDYLKKAHPSYLREYTSRETIKDKLNAGFIIPYRHKNTWTILPVLHHFLLYRTGVPSFDNDPNNYDSADYETIKKLLQSGANPHYVNDYGKNAFHYIIDLIKSGESEILQELLNEYARKFCAMELLLCTQQYPSKLLDQIFFFAGATREQIAHNTTDMFYPGTKFYRKIRKAE
jgi:hypothetical protein